MRYKLIPLVAVFGLSTAPALAGDIMSCSFDMPMPPPPHGVMMPGGGPEGMPKDGMMKPAGSTDKDAPPTPPPGGPMIMMRPIPAPSVDAKLNCSDKSQSSLKELVAKGWKLQTAVSTHGSATFYLTK